MRLPNLRVNAADLKSFTVWNISKHGEIQRATPPQIRQQYKEYFNCNFRPLWSFLFSCSGVKLHPTHFLAGYLHIAPGTDSIFIMKCLPVSLSGLLSIGTGIFFLVQVAVVSEVVRRYFAMYSL